MSITTSLQFSDAHKYWITHSLISNIFLRKNFYDRRRIESEQQCYIAVIRLTKHHAPYIQSGCQVQFGTITYHFIASVLVNYPAADFLPQISQLSNQFTEQSEPSQARAERNRG